MRTRLLLVAVAATAFAGAVYLLYRNLRHYSLGDLLASVAAIPLEALALAGCLTAVSYIAFTGFDALAVRYAREPLPYRKVALASFVSMSIGHNIGLAGFGSGALRYRFYSGWGVSMSAILRIVLFCSLTVGLGLLTLTGLASLLMPSLAGSFTGNSRSVTMLIGTICLGGTVAYLSLAALRRRPVHLARLSVEVPPLPLAVGQVVVGTINYAAVAGVLYMMISTVTETSYFAVVSVYVLAMVAGLVSQVPGGLGVLEAVVIALVPTADVFAALIAFRAIYYLLPLAIGGTLLLVTELGRAGTGARRHLARRRDLAETRATRQRP